MRYLFITTFSCLLLTINAQQWAPLFNGQDLSEFTVLNGSADYYVENGTIVGVSVMNTPNTFLATNRDYSDFILEFEVMIEEGLNSGVQIRSISDKGINNGRVHGYQVEIDASDRAWSGGIYDEARRGWLYTLSDNSAGRNAFNNSGWNNYRIEAVGPEIRTWINDVPCARLIDDMTDSGIIAFQVHGINNKKMAGKKVSWRNIRILTNDVGAYRRNAEPEIREVSYLINVLSKRESEKGWKLLWNGKDWRSWQPATGKSNQIIGWNINNGELSTTKSSRDNADDSHNLVSDEIFTEFILEFDFKVAKGAQSGLIYGSHSSAGNTYQLADDRLYSAKGQEKMTTGSLYGSLAAGNLSEPARNKTRYWGAGRWNKARIVAKSGIVQHWLNQILVLEYEQEVKGPIILQNSGDVVHFRSIKVKRFK